MKRNSIIKTKNMYANEKYKPASWFYILIIVICALIRFVPFSSGDAIVDDALNDFAIGASASTWVAWLLDMAECSRKNKERRTKGKLIFSEHICSVQDLCRIVAYKCKSFTHENDCFTFEEWFEKLSNVSNYPDAAKSTIKMSYRHIHIYVESIKTSLEFIRKQYSFLVESDMIDTDDFRQYITKQIVICNDICDNLKLENFDISASNKIDNQLFELLKNFNAFFPENKIEKYSRLDNWK